MSENENQIEVLGSVINITRDQLNRAMALNAELEAILTVERKQKQELEAKVAELEAQLSGKSSKTKE
jgi:BMFP domain-containing protein YqiC